MISSIHVSPKGFGKHYGVTVRQNGRTVGELRTTELRDVLELVALLLPGVSALKVYDAAENGGEITP